MRYFWHVDGPCSQDSLTALFAAPLLSAQFCAELLSSLPDGRDSDTPAAGWAQPQLHEAFLGTLTCGHGSVGTRSASEFQMGI